jgi:hypothetical protein
VVIPRKPGAYIMSDRNNVDLAIMLLEENKKILIEYLSLKATEHDWHGVSDAANDIRVIEAKVEVFKKLLERM